MIITLIKLILCSIYSEHDDETGAGVAASDISVAGQDYVTEIKGSHLFQGPDKNWQIHANVHKSYRLQLITICLHPDLLFSIKRKLGFLFVAPSNVVTKHIISAVQTTLDFKK